ncbi:amidohydrolase family protein [Streptomyces sp. NA02950]|uniref:metal-dependent hydrolase family protein n=1 Tax=Streptomyces sp. NA02950 TaxID=2742137 RepID=UPI001590C784|nr:amidohydrolase family protein [Streptomyces sp. NA02950]QKV97075.1 amidohydrolase family protein [Streptomyces sp. NA02950]
MRTVIHGGTVFDGSGSPPSPADIVIDDGLIIDVTPVGEGDGDTGFDATGLTVLPGLIDAHVHVMLSGTDVLERLEEPFSYQFYTAQRNLERTLDCGITTVRDAGGADLGVKRAAAEGLISGPDLHIAVSMLGQTGGHTDGWLVGGHCLPLFAAHPGRPEMIVDGPEEMRRRVRELVRAGADVIKVCATGGVLSPRDDPRHPQFSAEELSMCVTEAAAAGLSVMAHAQGAAGIKNALRAGVRSIEHGVFLDDECIELLLDKRAWLVPTLLVATSLVEAIDAGARMPAAVEDKARTLQEVHRQSVRRAIAAGVRIAMGTDSGVVAHGDNVRELALLQQAGLAPHRVLHAATASAAQLLGLDGERGSITERRRADLTLITGDPYDFNEYKERIAATFKAGVPVRTPALEESAR